MFACSCLRRNLLAKKKPRTQPVWGKQTDNKSFYDKGEVEWFPRPIHWSWKMVHDVNNTVMRMQLDGEMAEVEKFRELHTKWSQHPLKPMLGDAEPRFPRGIVKDKHCNYRKFKYRWHKANSPNTWKWLPTAGSSPYHREAPKMYPEYWRQRAASQKISQPQSVAR
jgi:hypothetical protein